MRKVSRWKGEGYLVSTASVLLLAIPAWKSAASDPLMLGCLIGGMLASVAGMGLRWRSHRLEQHRLKQHGHSANPVEPPANRSRPPREATPR